MNILLSDEEIIQEIKEFPNPNWIWIDIWEVAQCKIQIVISVNDKEKFKLSGHKVMEVCSMETDKEELADFKKYGKRIARLLRKRFPDSHVHSRLYYK